MTEWRINYLKWFLFQLILFISYQGKRNCKLIYLLFKVFKSTYYRTNICSQWTCLNKSLIFCSSGINFSFIGLGTCFWYIHCSFDYQCGWHTLVGSCMFLVNIDLNFINHVKVVTQTIDNINQGFTRFKNSECYHRYFNKYNANVLLI